jgi:hypothetical protein
MMGKPGHFLLCLGLLMLMAGPAYSQVPTLPDDLPKPPPLPQEMKDRAPARPPPDLPDPAKLIEQLKQLEELLSLSPEKLKSLRETLEFIEKMNPQEREAMRIRLSQVTQLTEDLRKEIDALAKMVSISERSNLSQFWLASSDEERETVRQELSSLEQDQQSEYLQKKIDAFVSHRDAVFEQMKSSLEAKQKTVPGGP